MNINRNVINQCSNLPQDPGDSDWNYTMKVLLNLPLVAFSMLAMTSFGRYYERRIHLARYICKSKVRNANPLIGQQMLCQCANTIVISSQILTFDESQQAWKSGATLGLGILQINVRTDHNINQLYKQIHTIVVMVTCKNLISIAESALYLNITQSANRNAAVRDYLIEIETCAEQNIKKKHVFCSVGINWNAIF